MRPLILLCSCLVLPGYGDLLGPKEVRGFEGDTVSLQCTYGEDLKQYSKYWCRERIFLFSRCSDTIYADEDGLEKTVGRVSIQNDPHLHKFTVTLRDLTLEDTGVYMCGVSRLGLDTIFLVSLTVSPGTSPHAGTSPPAGTPRPLTQLDSTAAEDTSRVPSSNSSESRVAIPMARILAPVLVLLTLLLAAGLAAFARCMFQRRKEAQLAEGMQKTEKVHPSHLASAEDEASLPDPEEDVGLKSPLHFSQGQLGFIQV
ncbi:PREDICTED: CMRF35-like molecule 9 [Condylura cristata]|uniref:CMRF35-like molecule 9 n=1 Tax=Condylura cristata TaxID=143302 RepID=UPI0006429592|nr:PREDICTED: CMRF35-like molecule 9 [Condylura cristata]